MEENDTARAVYEMSVTTLHVVSVLTVGIEYNRGQILDPAVAIGLTEFWLSLGLQHSQSEHNDPGCRD